MHLVQVCIQGSSFPTWKHYPFNIPSIRQTEGLHFRSRIAFFVGENGSGKSTLLDAIARRCGVQAWDKPRRHLAHANAYEDQLVRYVSVRWINGGVPGSLFRAETFREFADFLDDVAICDPGRLQYHGGHILNTLSHGESILSYFGARFRIKGLYFLDEPEAALSPASQIRFLDVLQQSEQQGRAQFIITTHSPILLAYPGAQIFCFDGEQIEEVVYEETTHYQLYKDFLTDRSAFLGSMTAGQHTRTPCTKGTHADARPSLSKGGTSHAAV